MSFRFQCKAAGDVLMLQETGRQVLAAMGVESRAQGIILARDIPAALSAIERALARVEADQDAPSTQPVGAGGAEPADEESVSLRQRAWPLIDMLKRARAEGVPVVWGV